MANTVMGASFPISSKPISKSFLSPADMISSYFKSHLSWAFSLPDCEKPDVQTSLFGRASSTSTDGFYNTKLVLSID
jgi:hypothetical protein